MNPRAGANLRGIPEKYRLTSRLWALSFYTNLEALRRASFRSALAFQLLQSSLSYAQDFYSKLLQDEVLLPFKPTWLEALGDLCRFRIVVLTMAEQGVGRLTPCNARGGATAVSWRNESQRWYLTGLHGDPGNGRLQHHLGLLYRDDETEALRSLYYFAKR
jgi:hypothetical protein